MNLIYAIVNSVNRKIYVGSTSNPKRRSIVHRSSLKNNRHFNQYLQNSYNKYGSKCFLWHVLETVPSIEKLEDRERFWIRYFNSDNRDYGYNIRTADEVTRTFGISEETRRKLSEINKGNTYCVGRTVSEETRRKISEANKGNNNCTGRPISGETRKKIGDANRGKKISKETRNKMSKVRKGRSQSKEHVKNRVKSLIGRKRSEETKKRMSESRKGKNKYKGVSLRKSGKYCVVICNGTKTKHVGIFDTKEEARIAYQNASKEIKLF